MSVWSAVKNSSKLQSLEQAFGAKDITGTEMKNAIIEWFRAYFDDSFSKYEDRGQRLPALIVNKLYKTVFSEYAVTVSGAQEQFLTPVLNRIAKLRKRAVQLALIGGECFIKPVIFHDSIDFVLVRRDAFIPFARDSAGKITDIGTTETTVVSGRYYTLLERRTVGSSGTLTVKSQLYQSDTPDFIGVPVPLDTLEKYAGIEPEITLPGVFNLGMVQLHTPMENTVDGSDSSVSVYAAAMGLIRNINRNERQLCDEFENGVSRIIASSDFLSTDDFGNKSISDTLFTAVDDNPENVGVTIFNPTLREASYLARKQEYLRNCESLIGLKRGILSEVEAAERTATEITSSEGDYNLTIIDFQECWSDALKELLSTCVRLGQLYHLTGSGVFDPENDIVIDWGDGVLYNRDKTWQEYSAMVASGLLKPELALAWYFDLPHDTPADIQKIRDAYMPEMEAILEDGGAEPAKNMA